MENPTPKLLNKIKNYFTKNNTIEDTQKEDKTVLDWTKIYMTTTGTAAIITAIIYIIKHKK